MIAGHGPTRQEVDSIGAHAVPAAAIYGIQTQRAVELNPLDGAARFADYPLLLAAMLHVKKAAARTNIETGAIEAAMGQATIRAIDDLLAGIRPEAFPVHGGGGISFNMDINEVLANIANARDFGVAFGTYAPIHPNDHVNANHSTADCFSNSLTPVVVTGPVGYWLDISGERLAHSRVVHFARWLQQMAGGSWELDLS